MIELSAGDVFAEKGSNQDTLRLLLEGRVKAVQEDGTCARSYLPSVVHGAPGLLVSGLLEPEQLIATTPCAVLLIHRGLFLMAMVKFGIVSHDSSEKWAILDAVPCLRSLPPRYASQLTHAMTPCEFIRGESVIPLGSAAWRTVCVSHTPCRLCIVLRLPPAVITISLALMHVFTVPASQCVSLKGSIQSNCLCCSTGCNYTLICAVTPTIDLTISPHVWQEKCPDPCIL